MKRNKVLIGIVAVITFLTLIAVNAHGAILIGGQPYQQSPSMVRITNGWLINQYQMIRPTVPVTPVTPPVTVPPTQTVLTADEQAMVADINRERANAGIAPVQVDMRLMTVARKKANDMVTNHYFSHTSPTYGTPWAMMTAEGIQYKYAGENIATNRTTSGAMTAWMASPGHRANILNPRFTHVGVAVGYQSPNIYVQEFAQE